MAAIVQAVEKEQLLKRPQNRPQDHFTEPQMQIQTSTTLSMLRKEIPVPGGKTIRLLLLV
jgi:hypothetical protein